jgi:dephospho-CoA kinase
VYLPGRPAYHEIIDAFGQGVVAEDGSIDRKKLGPIVFADPKNLAKLNAITHSRMKGMMREKLNEIEKQGHEIAVLEAALLLEAKWDDLADEIWVTVVDPEVAAARVAERSGLAREQVMERIRSQMTNEERTRRASVIIETSGDMASTEKQTLDNWDKVRARLASSS